MRRRIFFLSSIAFVVVSMAFLAGCNTSSTIPEGLIGVWQTDEEESADVTFDFSRERIVISSGTGVFEYTVEKVEEDKGHLYQSTLYSIYYLDRDGEINLMHLLYSPEDGGIIRFKSDQDVVWRKKG
ncbi:MAG TPA: hypothetical protein PLY57_02525 [Deltaproteobacteria bacterium]|nr:hypothetical protein [Deltaproteobacteria bacterium]